MKVEFGQQLELLIKRKLFEENNDNILPGLSS